MGEADRWFVGGLTGLSRGAQWAVGGIGAIGIRLLPRRWTGREPRRERLRRLLRAEARRSRAAGSGEELALFLENMATVLDLVLGGDLDLHDIAFEAHPTAEAAEAAGPAEQPNEPDAASVPFVGGAASQVDDGAVATDLVESEEEVAGGD